MTVIQQAIDETSAAADRYRGDTTCLEIHGSDILTSRHEDPYGWAAGSLRRLMVEIADDHAGCPVAACRTCEALRQGLSISLAALRGLQEGELD
ncbi:MAG: hypothetical protein ABW022_14935, partial [Actinoplanes sp.]